MLAVLTWLVATFARETPMVEHMTFIILVAAVLPGQVEIVIMLFVPSMVKVDRNKEFPLHQPEWGSCGEELLS